jgi:hypothetical protein
MADVGSIPREINDDDRGAGAALAIDEAVSRRRLPDDYEKGAEFRPILRSTWARICPFNEINKLALTKP